MDAPLLSDVPSLPGYGLPIDAREKLTVGSRNTPNRRFADAILHPVPKANLLTCREFTMMELMNRVTDKPGWERKVFVEATVDKWRTEILDSGRDVSEKMIDWTILKQRLSQGSALLHYLEPRHGRSSQVCADVKQCIAELRYKAGRYPQDRCVEALDGVYKSDHAVPNDLKLSLNEAVNRLEDSPDKDKDWHPGSNDQVLDLVHPSMYPLVYGQTKTLPEDTCNIQDCMRRSREGVTLKATEYGVGGSSWSKKYQWLPADFETPPYTDYVEVTSYINGLRPDDNRPLYGIIEGIVAASIPLWNATLSYASQFFRQPRITLEGTGYLESEDDRPRKSKDESFETLYDREKAWEDARTILQPEPAGFKSPQERTCEPKPMRGKHITPHKPVDLRRDFGRLQIIVKIANIHLTPEKPTYNGGSWHVEGQGNESICATALYYLSNENITPSALAFRQSVDSDIDLDYAQDDHRAIETIFGFRSETPAVQNLGRVFTPEGRLLAFPNWMQHRVQPFELADPTRAGHRKILALFLVDPHVRIISTANIPCQQKNLWEEQVRKIGPLGKLPAEITQQILDHVDLPVSLSAAKEQRAELMDGRKNFVAEQNRDFESMTFSVRAACDVRSCG